MLGVRQTIPPSMGKGQGDHSGVKNPFRRKSKPTFTTTIFGNFIEGDGFNPTQWNIEPTNDYPVRLRCKNGTYELVGGIIVFQSGPTGGMFIANNVIHKVDSV